MKNSVALIFIYNHNYEKNIDRLENIYAEKFTTILHVMPFYTGIKKNVVPVYENSHRFQGYITQSKQALLDTGCDTYVFAADDLLLNPDLRDVTLLDALGIPPAYCYLPFCAPNSLKTYWFHSIKMLKFIENSSGTEGMMFLPDHDGALKLLSRHFPQYSSIVPTSTFFQEELPVEANVPKKIQLPYPLLYSYSDFCIITRPVLPLFAHYCGIFSAMNLFVEIALPTALAFSTSKVATVFGNGYVSKQFWISEELNAFKLQYDCCLDKLLHDFPRNTAYIHPVKLSEWK